MYLRMIRFCLKQNLCRAGFGMVRFAYAKVLRQTIRLVFALAQQKPTPIVREYKKARVVAFITLRLCNARTQ